VEKIHEKGALNKGDGSFKHALESTNTMTRCVYCVLRPALFERWEHGVIHKHNMQVKPINICNEIEKYAP